MCSHDVSTETKRKSDLLTKRLLYFSPHKNVKNLSNVSIHILNDIYIKCFMVTERQEGSGIGKMIARINKDNGKEYMRRMIRI